MASKFHDHLGTKARRNSNYSKTFHYRLATPTRRELLTILKERFPKNTKTKKVMSRAMSPYMTQCADADVPLPPDWRNNRRKNKELGWRFQGILDRKMVLASRLPLTEVWAYKDPKGLCMALPRKNRKGEIQLLGMICQSKRKGNACFWDNKRRGTKPAQLIVGADTNYMKISEMQGGTELDENCTQCHRGRNVFIVHLGSPLKVAKVYPDKKTRYKPIPTGRISGLKGNPKTPWENPASFIPFNSNSDGCGQCHEIPALTIKYCDVVLKGVFKKNLMPPRGWGSWRDAEYIADFNKIADKCKKGFRGVSVDLRKALKLP